MTKLATSSHDISLASAVRERLQQHQNILLSQIGNGSRCDQVLASVPALTARNAHASCISSLRCDATT